MHSLPCARLLTYFATACLALPTLKTASAQLSDLRAEHLSGLLRGYGDARREVFGDTTRLQICKTRFAFLGAVVEREVWMEPVRASLGQDRLVNCGRSTPDPFWSGRGEFTVIDSVSAKATIATVYATVVRGEWTYRETTAMMTLPNMRWFVQQMQIRDLARFHR